MKDKAVWSPQSEQTHSRPYHHFAERKHPDDYRQEDIQALKRAIRFKENRLVLGIPGVGLSNLLRFLVMQTDWGERTVTFAYLHCETLGDCLDHETFFAEVARQLEEQGLGNNLTNALQGYDRLKRLLTQFEGDILDRVVVAVDKAGRMLAVADENFYRKLKALSDLNKGVCYIFVAGPRLTYVAGPDNILFAGRDLVVRPFTEKDFTGAVAEEGRRLEMKFDPAACKQLTHLTGGHPGLLRAVSSVVVVEALDLSAPEAELIPRLLDRGEVQHRCWKVWDVLDAVQQTALHSLLKGKTSSVDRDTLAWLQKFKLISKQRGEYRFFSPLFRQFVTNQDTTPFLETIEIRGATEKSCKGQRVVVAGSVFKGNQPVHVSSLELRLIACLKREQRIYTKDEIAAYIYCEDEKIENIEATIFNLIRQVRVRLGDKRYIKNYHGQGYEFQG